ncbi:MAG TPA: DUF433 domain-containing protein [Terriglobia bacterium]|nr:DUF433 domain-containing protein [Terriglobia bacterium]
MPTIQKSLRIRKETLRAMQKIAEERNEDFSTVANDLLDEATRMRRYPGIVFGHGPTGRRARIAGTGIDVWEIIANHKSIGHRFERLQKAYPQLTEAQLLAALNYYRSFRAEIDRRIRANSSWTPAKLRAQHPVAAGEIR